MALKTVKQILASRRERFRIPSRAQDVFAATHIWEDGLFKHGHNQYSRTYRFSDINYLVAGRNERKAMHDLYQDLLGVLGPGAIFKITANNRNINMATFQDDTLLPNEGDELDRFREEYNAVLLKKVADADGITQEKYITVTVFRPSLETARAYFNRIFPQLYGAFSALGSKLTAMDALERLRIFHDFFRPGQEDQFNFNFQDGLRRGIDFRDKVCPNGVKQYPNYIQIGDKFARALICIDYAAYVRDDTVARLTELSRNIMVSMDVLTLPRDEAVNEVELKQDGIETGIAKWQNRQNQNNNFSAAIPYDKERQREEIKRFRDELEIHDQGMNICTMTLIHTADSLEQLDADTETIMAVRDCKMFIATFQQLDAMATALPFGVCRIQASRTLLTRCLASVSMPFRVQEIQEPGGIWFGENALSKNLILCNRTYLQNQGMWILGVPGSGKSMFAKLLIVLLALSPYYKNDSILINDPDGEYAPIVRALGGTVIAPEAGGKDHINAMDMENGYGDKDPVADKTQFVMTLFEQMERRTLSSQEQSVVDRCVISLYSNAADRGEIVTLKDLHPLLQSQPEPEGKRLALTLERFTSGSLDIFSYETNVDLSNRIICFDQHKIRKQLRDISQTVIMDFITNRINVNSSHGNLTHVFNDEIQETLKTETSAEFFDSAWRRWRKRGGYPTAITQNASVVLNSDTGRSMLSNSEIVVMFNQAGPDQESLAKMFRIPQEQMKFVNDAEPGSGLLRYGKNIIPFTNLFPKDTELYQLMTTKPQEGFTGESDV